MRITIWVNDASAHLDNLLCSCPRVLPTAALERTVDVKEAVNIALGAVADAYQRMNISDLLLEEFEKTPDNLHWMVTVSFARPKPEGILEALAPFQRREYVRSYKTVEIEDASGKVVAMRMRPEK